VVSTVLKFFHGAQPPDWAIAVSVQTNILLNHAGKIGRRAMIHVPGRQGAVDAMEIVGLQA
jgi:hypothetical protein